MDTPRKPLWPKIVATVVVVVPVVYLLSFGPLLVLRNRNILPDWMNRIYLWTLDFMAAMPEPIWQAYYWYLRLWVPIP